jgi:hypothetical protein
MSRLDQVEFVSRYKDMVNARDRAPERRQCSHLADPHGVFSLRFSNSTLGSALSSNHLELTTWLRQVTISWQSFPLLSNTTVTS